MYKLLYLYVIIIAIVLNAVEAHGQLTASVASTSNYNCTGMQIEDNSNSLVFNEIMIAPNFGFDGSVVGEAGQEGSGEWIELYNTSHTNSFDASCYILGSSTTESHGISTQSITIPEGTIVPPLGFLVVQGVNAIEIPENLLVQNGGNTVAVTINFSNVCLENSGRFWLTNSCGWLGLYSPNGDALEVISWNLNLSRPDVLEMLETEPCVAMRSGCTNQASLKAYNSIDDSLKSEIANYSFFAGKSVKRNIDGGNWVTTNADEPTIGDCNSTCINPVVSVCNGTATVSVFGGTEPYDYTWNDPFNQKTAKAIGLCAGEYCCIITDSLGITETVCVTISDTIIPIIFNGESTFCSQDNPVTIDVSPPETAIISNVVNNSVFDPSKAPIGEQLVRFQLEVGYGCITKDSAVFTVKETPTMQVSTDVSLCENDTLLVDMSLSGEGNWNIYTHIDAGEQVIYEADTNIYQVSISSLTPGFHTVHVDSLTAANGCPGNPMDFPISFEIEIAPRDTIEPFIVDNGEKYKELTKCFENRNTTITFDGISSNFQYRIQTALAHAGSQSFSQTKTYTAGNNQEMFDTELSVGVNTFEIQDVSIAGFRAAANRCLVVRDGVKIVLKPTVTVDMYQQKNSYCFGEVASFHTQVSGEVPILFQIDGSWAGSDTTFVYTQTTPDTTWLLQNLTPGTYDLKMGSAHDLTSPKCASDNQPTISFIVNALPEVDINGISSICKGEKAPISFTFTGKVPFTINYEADGLYSKTFIRHQVTDSINMSKEVVRIYATELIDGTGCKQHIFEDTLTIDRLAPTEVSFDVSNKQGCPPLLSSVIMPASGFQTCHIQIGEYTFNTCLDTFPIRTFTEPGFYDLSAQLIDNQGCEVNVDLARFLEVYTSPIADFVLNPDPIEEGDLKFELTENTQAGVQFEWSVEDSLSMFGRTFEGAFVTFENLAMVDSKLRVTLTTTAANSCTNTITKWFPVYPKLAIYVPSAFTPDEDGFNDTFKPVFSAEELLKSYQLSIYNRWGEEVYRTNDPYAYWTGKTNGTNNPDQVHNWIINYTTFRKSKPTFLRGRVTLLR